MKLSVHTRIKNILFYDDGIMKLNTMLYYVIRFNGSRAI
ncbi:hypothetical protein NARC_150015 [Candidatus Nitrosocosmicus arcticus]|uniref:Uncharacterized protein n=1 Tax=Candidatus Nitrosocosmicus arcticus TaxID=2035267 RepID=A0A557SS38_9ARCH|nr:hypothetical protein NARC_150015 [Candidatus Nitrosocosmicus arcticus]